MFHSIAIQKRKNHQNDKGIIKYSETVTKEKLYLMNMFPIQAAFFNRRLFLENGGFDTSLKLLEDWDLWIRYHESGRFKLVNKVTSIYFVPGEYIERKKRYKQLKSYTTVIRKKHNISDNQLKEFKKNNLITMKEKVITKVRNRIMYL